MPAAVAANDVNILEKMLSLIPTVSDSEMEEINRELGEPGQYEKEEFENLDLSWIGQ